MEDRTQPTSSKRSYEEAMKQARASAGNMGEKSPVYPDSWRGQKTQVFDPAKLRYFPPKRPEAENTQSDTIQRPDAGTS